ncbi:MAG TPA: hypothetical protein VFU28_12235 [Vicinamibacterales bacterium]|nr:hypothetical protein [Vicinamibacterales bacterium]
MTPLSSEEPQVTAAVLDDEQYAPRFPTCPLCHTPTSLTQNAIDAGADWRCVTCGQRWDAARLSAVAAYAAWVVERAVIGPKEL